MHLLGVGKSSWQQRPEQHRHPLRPCSALRSRLKRQKGRVRLFHTCCAQQDDTSDAFERRALHEAAEVYDEARRLAEQQTRDELLQAWKLDNTPSSGSSQPGIASKEQSTMSSSSLSSSTGSAAAEPAPHEALVALLQEHGLTQAEAQQLLRDLQGTAVECCSLGDMAARLQALQRVLPGLEAERLACREPALLLTASGNMVGALVVLVDEFQGLDVMGMVTREPRLLLQCAPDLRQRVSRVLAHLVRLHPSRRRSVVAAVVADNPQLLFRMDYCSHAMLLDELPVEIQNMFVLTGTGLGFLYKYYAASSP